MPSAFDPTKTTPTKIEIYTSMTCGYCMRALHLLNSKNVTYDQIDVTLNADLRAKMRSRAGGSSSVPQVFINDDHIGGCDELYALERAGKLDMLLS
ncbi:MAG: glutaredoxin 3 [Bacteroidetes bacterium]|jgi:glutaredoxin 3|nr:glutaredoxin 3 [Bacteroidota bacterium]